MNHLERFNAVMNFQPADRLPRIEWAPWWTETLDRWRGEGLPDGDDDAIARRFGLDVWWRRVVRPLAPDCPAPPAFGAGIVETASDYERVREHLYPPFDEKLAEFAELHEAQSRGEGMLWIALQGFFWLPRHLFGIERHLYAFHDQPDLMLRMADDLADYYERLLAALVDVCRPGFIAFNEDMSYNHGPMLSEEMFERFIAPGYRRLTPLIRRTGAMTFIDSDGDVTEMIPWLMRSGIDGILPLERQAGVDAAELRRRHPTFRMIGHYDKTVMHRGELAMREEFQRLLPLMRAGGFVSSVDHQTPPDVSLDQYRQYVELLCEYTARAAKEPNRA